MESLERNLSLIKYNCKILFNINTLVAIAFILGTPFLFSLILLSYDEIAKICELYLPISGIILFSYIGNIEKEQDVYEITYTKQISHMLIFLLRLVALLTVACIFIGGVIYYSKLQGGAFPFWEIFLGSIITTLYLGLISLTITTVSNSTPLGYLIAICYFTFEFMTGGKYTESFYAFSLINGSFHEKYNIVILIIGMLAFNTVIIYRRS